MKTIIKKSKTLFGSLALAILMVVSSCEKIEDNKVTPQKQVGELYNDINYTDSKNDLDNYIIEIAEQLRIFRESNPNSNDKELNSFAKKIMTNSDATSRNAKISYTDITGRLNKQEMVLYNNHLAKALLCIANGVFANNYTDSNYQSILSVIRGGNGDAFRHTIWNFGMTIDVGSEFTKKWSDAHEYGDSGAVKNEQTMDLYNNNIGIQLGIANPNTRLHSTFVSISKNSVRNGKCLILVKSNFNWSNSVGEK